MFVVSCCVENPGHGVDAQQIPAIQEDENEFEHNSPRATGEKTTEAGCPCEDFWVEETKSVDGEVLLPGALRKVTDSGAGELRPWFPFDQSWDYKGAFEQDNFLILLFSVAVFDFQRVNQTG